MGFVWTQERVEKLRVLWNGSGDSASVCGLKLGCNRNAVLGKINRLRKEGIHFVERTSGTPGSFSAQVKRRPWQDQRRPERREHTPSVWTSDKVEKLIEWANEGVSSTGIAFRFNNEVTPNAVRKKAGEIGLRLGFAGLNQGRPKFRAPRPSARTEALSDGTGLPKHPPMMKRVPLERLQRHECRFPLWSAEHKSGDFCGNKAIPGLPYCPNHAVVCHEPKKRRRAA